MSGRRWAAVVVTFAIALIVAWLLTRGGDDVSRRPTTSAVAVGTTDETSMPATSRHRPVQQETAPSPQVPPAPTPPDKRSIVVHVFAKEDHAPIAGAGVHVDIDDDANLAATADATGTASFADVPRKRAAVWAEAAERQRSSYVETKTDATTEESVEVVLDRGALFEGVVLDVRDGRPIVGATVHVEEGGNIDGDSASIWAPTLGDFTTGADGRFRTRVPPDTIVTASVSAKGFVARARSVRFPAGDAARPPVELRLEPGGALRGVVRDPDGHATKGVKVYAVPANHADLVATPDEEISGGVRRALVAETDADGRFELNGLARGGAYVAFAKADGWGRSLPREGILVTDSAPEAGADFALRRLGTLVLHVVDADGKPTAAHLQLYGATIAEFPRDVGADGVCRVDHADPANYQILATRPGSPTERSSVDVPDGATVETTVRFTLGVEVSGIVVDDKGDPVAGAEVTVRRPWTAAGEAMSPSEGKSTPTAADGRFRVEGLRTGVHVAVAFAIGYVYDNSGQPVESPAKDVRCVLMRNARLKIHVVVPAGASPPSSFAVHAETFWETRDDGVELWSGNGSSPEQFGDGRFEIDTVKPGTCRVRVVSTEFAAITTPSFELAPGATVDLGDVTLDPGVDLAGRIEDLRGAPVAGATLTAGESFSPEFRNAATSTDGAFRLHHMALGRNELVVKAPGFVEATIRADVAAGAPLVVRLARGAVLRVTVVDAAGAPVASAEVTVRAAGAAKEADDEARGGADNRGVFQARIGAGKYRVTVADKDTAADVEVSEGVDTSVRLVVK